MTTTPAPVSSLLATDSVDTDLGTVRVARLGQGHRPPLVLVHGYPDNLQIWSRTATLVGRHHPVVAFDWPGLGHSAELVSGATPFHLGRHLAAVLDALRIDHCIPVGFDMGGHAAVAFTHANPDRVQRLVLTNFLALGDVATSWEISVMRRLGLNRVLLGRAPRLVFARAQRTFLGHRAPLTAAVRHDLWTGFRRPATRRHLIRMSAGYQASLPRIARLYPQIVATTLVLWADQDPHFPPAQGEQLAARLPDARLAVLGGRSHWFMWEDPERTAEALLHHATAADDG